MKNPIKKTENWTMDENWNVNSLNQVFNIRNVEALVKIEDVKIAIFFHGPALTIDLKTKKDRNGVWEFLKKCKSAYYAALKKQQDTTIVMQKAQLAIQNRMAGKMCG